MVFRMFVGGTFDHYHERKQMDDVRKTIQGVYRRIPDEWCFLLVDLYVNGCQLDGIMLKKDKLIILEMKNYHGRIVADLAEGAQWRVISLHGDPYATKFNPFRQIRRQRGAVASKLEGIPELNFPVQDEMATHDEPRQSSEFICGCVVLPDDTEVEIINNDRRNDSWFKIVRISELANWIALETSPRTLRIESEDLAYLFAEKVAAKERKPDDWLAGSPDESLLRQGAEKSLADFQYFSELRTRIEALDDTKDENTRQMKELVRDIDFGRFRFRALDEMLRSQSSDRIVEAIRIVVTLGFPQYCRDLIMLTGNPSPNVRYQALDALQHLDHNEDITRPLLKLMKDESTLVRELAIRLLMSEGSASATPDLIQIMMEGSEEEALQALRLLEDIGDERAVEPLIQICNEYGKRFPKSFFRNKPYGKPLALFISALGKIGYQKATDFILALLKDENLKEIAIEALGNIGDARAKEPLTELLKNESDIYVIRILVRAVGEIGAGDTAHHLHKYLETEDEELFIDTVQSLRRIRSISSFMPVWDIFVARIEREDFKQFRLAELLADIDPGRFEEQLMPLLAKKKETKTRLAAATWIRGVASRRHFGLYFSLLDDQELWEYAGSAILQMIKKESNAKDILQRVAALLQSDNESKREIAIRILADIDRKQATILLSHFIDDCSESVRETVVRELWICLINEQEQAIPLLIRMLQDKNEKVGFAALTRLHDCMYSNELGFMFAKKHGISFPSALMDLIRSANTETRRTAMLTAAYFWGDEALEHIGHLTKDQSEHVRKSLATALVYVGTAQAEVYLEDLAEDNSTGVQERSIIARDAVRRKLRGESYWYPIRE